MKPWGYKAVCFKCRYTAKKLGRCPFCRNDLINLGKKAIIPRKNDDKGWEALRNFPKVRAIRKGKRLVAVTPDHMSGLQYSAWKKSGLIK